MGFCWILELRARVRLTRLIVSRALKQAKKALELKKAVSARNCSIALPGSGSTRISGHAFETFEGRAFSPNRFTGVKVLTPGGLDRSFPGDLNVVRPLGGRSLF